jgi:multicomponent Na+:H+ antiporter subunit A
MPPEFTVLAAAVGLPFLAAALVPLAYRAVGERVAYFAAVVAAVCLGLVASQAGSHGAAGVEWIPALDVSLRFYVDGLALLVAGLASGVGVLVFVYSAGYMHDEPGHVRYYATMLAFMGSMLGVALAADLVALFVFWELTSVCSFLLIGHYQEPAASRYAARKALFITAGGGLFLLVGFLVLATTADTFAIAGTPDALLAQGTAVRTALAEQGLLWPAVLLVGVGAAAKSAQVPLHVWLPNAMEAPTPVSAFLHSATMVKAGVYLVGRFRPFLLGEEWTLLFATLGLLTMTVAALLAVGATDIKELLAYSTASHLGLIVAGFGFAEALGAETGALHILNHAAFKAALFLVAGIVAHEAGTRALDELGGLRRDLPVTATVATVAALGMAGLPPFNGFYSKELLFETTWEFAVHAVGESGAVVWAVPAVAVLGSVFTFLYSIRFLHLFFGEKPAALADRHVHSPPAAMLAPVVVLGVLAAVLGVAPQRAVDLLVGDVVAATAPGAHGFTIGLPTKLKPAVLMSVVTVGAGVLTYPVYGHLHRGVGRLTATAGRPNWWYDRAVEGASTASEVVAPLVQNGLLRTYATWTLAATSVLALAGYVAAGVSMPSFAGVTVTAPMVLVLVVAVLAAVAIPWAPSHVAGVLTLSILGFMVAIFYILASAPDLALTQLVVETLVLVLFLLVLDKLPAYYGEIRRSRAVRDGALSLLVGGTVALTVLVSTAADPAETVGQTLVERAPLPEDLPHHGTVILRDVGGGGNVVNVILVDFRGLDTLGEISVVGMAGLSVLTLLAMRARGEGE